MHRYRICNPGCGIPASMTSWSKITVIIGLVGILCACQGSSTAKSEASDPALIQSGEPDSTVIVPEGAIEISEGAGVWMVPTRHQQHGCVAYTKWSPYYLVDTAIYLQLKEGGFTMDMSRTDCQ